MKKFIETVVVLFAATKRARYVPPETKRLGCVTARGPAEPMFLFSRTVPAVVKMTLCITTPDVAVIEFLFKFAFAIAVAPETSTDGVSEKVNVPAFVASHSALMVKIPLPTVGTVIKTDRVVDAAVAIAIDVVPENEMPFMRLTSLLFSTALFWGKNSINGSLKSGPKPAYEIRCFELRTDKRRPKSPPGTVHIHWSFRIERTRMKIQIR